MKNKPTVTMAFEESNEQVRHMMPATEGIKVRLLEVKKAALSESLRSLAGDLREILQGINTTDHGVRLRQISIAVQLTTEGGIAWIASAKTGLSNSMTMTFEVDSKLVQVAPADVGETGASTP